MKKILTRMGKPLVFLIAIAMLPVLYLPAVYAEDADPELTPGTEFSLTGDWVKYEPCNELEIDSSVLDGTVIVAKGTGKNPDVIWSVNELGEDEKNTVIESMHGVPGSGNPKKYEFISGESAGAYGMTVDSDGGKIIFERPNNWALIYGNGFIRTEIINKPQEPVEDPEVIPEESSEDPEVIPEEPSDDPEVIPQEPADDPEDPAENPDGPEDEAPDKSNESAEKPDGILAGPEEMPKEDVPAQSPEEAGPETDVTEEPVYAPVRAELISADYLMSSGNTPEVPEVIEEAAAAELIAEEPEHVLDAEPKTSLPAGPRIGLLYAFICLVLTVVLYLSSKTNDKSEK